MSMIGTAFQVCINPNCGAEFDCAQAMFKCPACGELLDIRYDWDKVEVPDRLSDFAERWANRNTPLDFSGVWRFRELLNFCEDKYKVTIGEGQTILQQNNAVAEYVDMQPGFLYLQYEGLNPSGSFKDNGMTAAFSHAKMVGQEGRRHQRTRVGCPGDSGTRDNASRTRVAHAGVAL